MGRRGEMVRLWACLLSACWLGRVEASGFEPSSEPVNGTDDASAPAASLYQRLPTEHQIALMTQNAEKQAFAVPGLQSAHYYWFGVQEGNGVGLSDRIKRECGGVCTPAMQDGCVVPNGFKCVAGDGFWGSTT